jgi:metal-responsive CopG/Arc/MetJ family transcriptional regulator
MAQQVTVNLSDDTVKEIDALVSAKNDEFIKRADMIRAILEVGIKHLRAAGKR